MLAVSSYGLFVFYRLCILRLRVDKETDLFERHNSGSGINDGSLSQSDLQATVSIKPLLKVMNQVILLPNEYNSLICSKLCNPIVHPKVST